jgi:uncharacterized ubiquitin-like protein YukD
LPFDTENYEFSETSIDRGAEARLYLLQSKDIDKKSLALKVYKPVKQKLNIEEQAKALRQEVKEAKTVYSQVPDLIPDEHYLIMEDPFMKGKKAVALVEEFYGRNLKDVFSYSVNQLAKLAEAEPEFKKHLLNFIDSTVSFSEQTRKVIDIVGENNLVLVETKQGTALRLVDPHNFRSLDSRSEIVRRILEEKLNFLKELKNPYFSGSLAALNMLCRSIGSFMYVSIRTEYISLCTASLYI